MRKIIALEFITLDGVIQAGSVPEEDITCCRVSSCHAVKLNGCNAGMPKSRNDEAVSLNPASICPHPLAFATRLPSPELRPEKVQLASCHPDSEIEQPFINSDEGLLLVSGKRLIANVKYAGSVQFKTEDYRATSKVVPQADFNESNVPSLW